MPATDVFAAGSTALITGAGSGIGLALAKFCAGRGMNVFVADIKSDAIQTAQEDIKSVAKSDARIATAVADVSKLDDWASLKSKVQEAFGSVELLALNAGVGLRGGWGDDEYFRKTLETNLFGVLNGINTMLPVVQQAAKSKPTSVIVTGSKQGITNPPGNPAYNASKAAVKSLTEQLSWELKGSNTSVHLLVPGWTFTGMTSMGSAEKPAGAWHPDQVVDFLYGKMEKDEFYALCPDNDVSETTDKKRVLWTAGDMVKGRPPLSRWRDEWKKEAEETMAITEV